MRKIEGYQLKEFPEAEFLIIGDGKIGDKAGQLLEKTPLLRELGFKTPPRYVLAQGFFDAFFRQNGIGSSTQNKISDADFTSGQFNIIRFLNDSLSECPALAVRSSASGDARGTGIYHSEFCQNNPAATMRSIRQVLAGYFTENAAAFRRDAKKGEDMAVMIEPVVGQMINTDHERSYVPLLSGFAYTSTPRSGAYINAVTGLGGGVDSRGGERITKDDLIKSGWYFGSYLMRRKRETFNLHRSVLVENYQNGEGFPGYGIQYLYDKRGDFEDGWYAGVSSHLLHDDLSRTLSTLNLERFFMMLEKAESLFAGTQYLEWAMTMNEEDPDYWILQIADVEKKLDYVDFEEHGTPLLTAHHVLGSGARDSQAVVFLNNPDFDELYEFNGAHKDYVLIYEARLVSRGSGLDYKHFSNAHTILELPNTAHALDPIEHFNGKLEETDKFFGVIRPEGGEGTILERIYQNFEPLREQMEGLNSGIGIYRHKVRAVADERQNRLVLYKR